MPTTSNFGWTTPADTDLVKDGAAAIRTLGNGIDTSLVDLKGGTTGQILSKASNTDLDFTWTSDATGIQATIFDAKGDLIAASAADTAARLASSGVNGDVLTVDTSTSTGLKWAAVAAGGMTQLATGTLSSTAVNLTSIAGTYKELRLVVTNLDMATNNRGLQIRLNNDSANNYSILTSFSTNLASSFTASEFAVQLSLGTADSKSLLVVSLPDYANTTSWKMASVVGINSNQSNAADVDFRAYLGAYNQTGAITQINLLTNGGNFDGGTYTLYGVK